MSLSVNRQCRPNLRAGQPAIAGQFPRGLCIDLQDFGGLLDCVHFYDITLLNCMWQV